MRKLDRLIQESRASATFHGHVLGNFIRFSKVAGHAHRAKAFCKVCGMSVWIETDPEPNSIDISGDAIAIECCNPFDYS